MAFFTKRSSKKIDTVFAFSLLILFAATALCLVLIGAKQYRSVTHTMSKNHEARTTASYLAEKIRQHDTSGAITVCNIEDIPALAITLTENDVTFITYIYFYEDALRELVVTEHSQFSLTSGQSIIPMQNFSPSLINPSLLCTEITDTAGEKKTYFFPLHSNIGKEDT